MTHNKFAILDDEYHLKYKEEQEMNDNQLLVARLNSELNSKRENDRHIDAAIIDSGKIYIAEQHMAASKQMEDDRKLGLFGDYPEIKSALRRNYNTLLKIENLRNNEVIPDDFI